MACVDLWPIFLTNRFGKFCIAILAIVFEGTITPLNELDYVFKQYSGILKDIRWLSWTLNYIRWLNYPKSNFLDVFISMFGVILVRIFPHSDWIRTTIAPNTDTFHAVLLWFYSQCCGFNDTKYKMLAICFRSKQNSSEL